MTDAFTVRADLGDAAELARAFARSPEMVTEELTVGTREASLLLEREIRDHTPVGVGGGGGLRGSWSAREPRVLADNVIGEVGTPSPYALAVELGTKPHFPPVQPLADWAQYKLGLSPAEARGVGFVIARKIAQRGTEGAHMVTKGIASAERSIQTIFARARERIAERLRRGK